MHWFVQVKKAQVMYDPHTRESRGFGFVTMESGEEADAAITAMNGTELMGKSISVEKVRVPRPATITFPLTAALCAGATWPREDAHPRPLLRAAEEARL